MQNFRTSNTYIDNVAFATKIEDIIGGITLTSADFADKDIVPAGTPVGKGSGGKFRVIKTLQMQDVASNTDVAYKVLKGSNVKVGDIIASATGAKAYAITAIDKTNTDYDLVTVGTTLGVALVAGDVLFQAAAVAASNTSALLVTPFAVTGSTIEIKAGDTNVVDAYIRASLITAAAAPVSAAIKSVLQPNILWL